MPLRPAAGPLTQRPHSVGRLKKLFAWMSLSSRGLNDGELAMSES